MVQSDTHRAENGSEKTTVAVCLICGEPTEGKDVYQAYLGWMTEGSDEIALREDLFVVCDECWPKLSDAERDDLLEQERPQREVP
jgi:hypothetical protein